MPTLHELHRNVFTGQKFDTNGLQGIADGSVWSIDGPATINNSSSTAFSIATKSTWSTLVVQNTDATDDTSLGIALKGHDSIGGIAHITTAANKGRTSIISSTDGGTTNRESLTVSPEGYIGIGQINPTAAINPKGTLDTNFAGTVTTAGGKVTGVTIVDGGSSITAGSLVFSGGGGTGAAGTYTVASGVIDTISITNAGSSYETPPTVVGNGTSVNATLTAIVDSVVTVSTAHGIREGDAVSLDSGAGSALENFTVSSVANTTQFLIDSHPATQISSASPATSNKVDSSFVKIESGDGNSLLVIDKTGHIGIGGTPRTSLDVVSTDAIIVPTGTPNQAPGGTASQIGTAIAGMLRFDSTAEVFKGYDGAAWVTLAEAGVSDADGDTKINPEVTSDADDLVFYTAGSIRMTIDQAGAITHSGTITIGSDGTGHDVTFYGAASGAYMRWDEDVDDLILAGAARAVIPDGQLVLGSTAITSTAAELNILDGVTTTAAELNLIDGGTARGTDAIADGDGVLINDAGTMKMTTVQTLSAYLDDEITAMPNLVTTAATTVGALDAGSITSNFTSIDVGAGAITTTGTISAGTLDVADAGIAIIPNSTSYNNQTTNGEIELVKTGGNGYIYFYVGSTKYRVQGSAV